ncbi:MAG: T9SS type A sorting domain-containing protein [Aequorivita sp.]|nr:T9SS type A sorting domain-containing protein [Aequorivita sp.]
MKILIWALTIVCNISIAYSQAFDFEVAWSTYFGDESISLSDSAMDSQGNFYFVGSLKASSIFAPTAGSFQPIYGGGEYDGFLVKMSPQGDVVLATYFGGEESEGISGIVIDNDDKIYIAGSTSSTTGIATPNSYQPVKDGISDIFIARFSSAGIREWATYYPDVNASSPNLAVGNYFYHGFDIVADNLGNIYFFNRTANANAATPDTFQMDIGQPTNNIITKFTTEGARVWATYYGINFSNIYSIAIGNDGLYVAGTNLDCPPTGSYNTYFSTIGSHQSEPGNCKDVFVSKFSLDGNRLWSTYYGNSYQEYLVRSALLVDGDFLYFSGISRGQTNITTPGSYQEDSEIELTPYLVRFNSMGERQWGTYIGLNHILDNNGLPYAMLDQDSMGNIYMFGLTRFGDNISTPTAFQPEKNALNDTYLAIFNPNGELKYGTYFGGSGEEYGSRPIVSGNTVYLFGQTSSTLGITTPGSFQPNYIENATGNYDRSIFITKIQPVPLGVNDIPIPQISIYPNPNNGNFRVNTSHSTIQTVAIYNVLGQRVYEIFPKKNTQEINMGNLETGLYFIVVTLENNIKKTLKILVK